MDLRIDVDRCAAARAAGSLVVDVREPDEYVAGHVPGAMLVPLGQVAARASDLRRGGPVLVICASGNRSLTAAGTLRRLGIEAYSVDGGTKAWIDSGRPTVTGPRAATA